MNTRVSSSVWEESENGGGGATFGGAARTWQEQQGDAAGVAFDGRGSTRPGAPNTMAEDEVSMLHVVVSLLIVGIAWGCTNPLLRRASAQREVEEAKARATLSPRSRKAQADAAAASGTMQMFADLVKTVKDWRFFVPFVVNQSGSVLYYYLLGSVDLSMAVPICNSLTFVFTALASRLLGEQQVGPRIIGGMVCILAGVSVCVYSKL